MPLTCSFGTPWEDHFRRPVGTGKGCRPCLEETLRAVSAFSGDVAAGIYDAQGYTPAERRLQQKRRGQHE